MILPKHQAGLYLTHNEHKDVYETVKEWIEDAHPAYDTDDFISQEDMQKCIDTDDCWSLQWYPHTPISFHKVRGSSLELVLKRAMEIDAEINT